MTVNGRMAFMRTVFWNKDHGTVIPMDGLLGIESSSFSHGVREICCRESLNTAFVPASDNIQRLAQLDISSSTVRQIVEGQGRIVVDLQRKGQIGPDFTSQDCTGSTVIVGSDGVMVPRVTKEQKQKSNGWSPAYRGWQSVKICPIVCSKHCFYMQPERRI